ncbi:phosphotransferase [Nocardia terpenica]|uniref:phosphotransferase n=1 Tax=Nocardia terpenica TaxID=455432 RepID=UPI002B4B9137|nr:phosphotransferase [Nocardia terpenica]
MPHGELTSIALSPRSDLDLPDLARTLKGLHALPRPHTAELAELDPFAGLAQAVTAARTLAADDREWLRQRLAELQGRWKTLPTDSPWCVICGPADLGDLLITGDDHIIPIGIQAAVIGPPEWDLVPTAIEVRSLDWRTNGEYAQFCRVYGTDVTRSGPFYLLRDIQEFTMTVAVAHAAATDSRLHDQAAHRLACLRGEVGHRPWPGWTPIDRIDAPAPTAHLPIRGVPVPAELHQPPSQ